MTSRTHTLLIIFFCKNIVSEPLLDPIAVAEAGTVIAEASADYVVDLLCGCGCRFVDVKTCLADTKKACKDIVKDLLRHPLDREGVYAPGGPAFLAHTKQKVNIVGLTALRLAFFMGYE